MVSASELRPWTWQGDSPLARSFLWYIRRVKDHPAKIRLVRWGMHGLFQSAIPIVARNGARLTIDSEDWIGRQICFHDGYEPLTLARCADLLSGGGVLVDVGACFGLFTCVVRFISPDPTNRGRNRVAVPADAEAGFYVAAQPFSSILDREVEHERVRILKVDVEGLELRVLRGLAWDDAHKPENIFLELNSCVERAEGQASLLSFLLERGYEALTVTGEPLVPGQEPPEFNVWFRSS